jgi:hypothetical protein
MTLLDRFVDRHCCSEVVRCDDEFLQDFQILSCQTLAYRAGNALAVTVGYGASRFDRAPVRL